MTPADFDHVVRLRKLRRLGNASLKAIVSRLDNTGTIRPNAEQWADLWPVLEAANTMAQKLADQLAAQVTAQASRRRGRKANVTFTLASRLPIPK